MLNLNKSQRYLLACSYGPDSMALFSMLQKEGYYFEVAHVNYHLRDEATSEQENLKAYCTKHNVIFHLYEVKESYGKSNLEKQCRDIRYHFFADVLKARQLNSVLVAHHQDDLIETYLMQMRRRNLVLYYGIMDSTFIYGIPVLRPLLAFSKKQLLDYCYENSVPFAIDKSNFTNQFLRNKIRHDVIDHLTPEKRQKYLLEIKKKNVELLEIVTKVFSEKIETNCELLRLNELEFLYALVLKARALKPDFKLSKKQGVEIRKIVASKTPNITLEVDGILFQKHYDKFAFSLPNKHEDFSYLLISPGILDTPYFYLNFIGDASNRNVQEKDYPLTIRNAHPKDEYMIKNYSKTLRRLFIDWKVPLYLRKRWPIIVNYHGKIIYVPRYKNDFIIDTNSNFYVKI